MADLIKPHGSDKLVPLLLEGDARQAELERAGGGDIEVTVLEGLGDNRDYEIDSDFDLDIEKTRKWESDQGLALFCEEAEVVSGLLVTDGVFSAGEDGKIGRGNHNQSIQQSAL